jgi:Alpha galactosidase A/Alpha galactosidase C-terminal beta sandwich domain
MVSPRDPRAARRNRRAGPVLQQEVHRRHQPPIPLGEPRGACAGRPRSVALGLALLCAACACALLAAPAGAAPSLGWSGPLEIDRGQALGAVSCPSMGLCVAVDGAGRASVSNDPALASAGAWSAPFALPGAGSLRAVSCASTTLCAALDGEGRLSLSTRPTAPGSGSWAPAFSLPAAPGLTSVSCPASTLCVAVDGTGHAVVSTDPASPSAGAWSAPFALPGAGALSSVSCTSATLCAAVDGEGHVFVSTEPAAGTGAWHERLVDLTSGLIAVSCLQPDSCVALDGAGVALASADVSAAISGPAGPGSGATWSSTAFDALGAPATLSCVTSGLCVAVDGAGYAFASDDPTAAPPQWPASGLDVQPSVALRGVSCVAEGLCVAVDGAGRAFTAEVPAPTVSTGPASEVGHTTATLTGIVDPHDAALSACRFEYGSTVYYGASVPCASTLGGAPQPVAAFLPGLGASTSYHFRLVASSAIGTSYGADTSFTTQAPGVVQPHPSITGPPAPGQTLTCHSGVSATVTGVSIAYAWLRDTRAIAGAAGTTYAVGGGDVSHVLQCRVTTTTAEGSASATSAFVTVPAGGLGTIAETAVGAPRVGRYAVAVPLRCSAQAAGSCTLQLRLTVKELIKGGRVVAIAAQSVRAVNVTVGARTVRLKPGQRYTATLTLNSTGRRLLAHAHRLAARLTVSGTVVGVLSAALRSTTVTFGGSGPVKASLPRASKARVLARGAGGATSSAALAPTPYMGWDTYFTFGGYYDEAAVLAQASQLQTRGLEREDYRYVWLDVGWWQGTRAGNGEITVNPAQWPHGMAWLARTLHAAGFKVGLYTDAGSVGCGGPTDGAYGHYQQDVNTFAAWGFDAVKVDFCGGVRRGLQPAAAYAAFHEAIVHNSSHRPMLLSICNFLQPGQFATEDPAIENSAFASYTFGPSSGNSWRTDTDVGAPGFVPFANVLRNIDADAAQPQAAGPGHWNDPDYLGPGQGMTDAQFRTQFSMWAMLAAPLMISADLISLSPPSASIVANREAVAIDQDPAGLQGRLLSASGEGEVWVKPLADGSRAVALLNRGASTLRIATTPAAVGLPGASSYAVRNVWTGSATGVGSSGALAANVPGGSTVLLRVSAK